MFLFQQLLPYNVEKAQILLDNKTGINNAKHELTPVIW